MRASDKQNVARATLIGAAHIHHPKNKTTKITRALNHSLIQIKFPVFFLSSLSLPLDARNRYSEWSGIGTVFSAKQMRKTNAEQYSAHMQIEIQITINFKMVRAREICSQKNI